MKYIYHIIIASLLTGLLSFTACNDFDEMNTNPTKSPVLDANSQLSYAQLSTWGDWQITETYHFYLLSFTQLMQGEWNVTNWGGQYRRDDATMGQLWSRMYGVGIKNLVDVIDKTKDDEDQKNLNAVARIMKVYYFLILTDIYGDIPYFDAGKGLLEEISSPVYNKQEAIYDDFLSELKLVEQALDVNADAVSGDIVYSGDINKWKRFANSMRLRIAMRLVKVNPARSLTEVKEVFDTSSGLLTKSDDALIEYMDIYDWDITEIRRNAMAQRWRGRDSYPEPFICSVFWDKMMENNDPRILRIARTYDETVSGEPFSRIDLTDEIVTAQGMSKFQPPMPGYFWYDKWPSGYWSSLTQKWQDKSCRPQLNKAFLKGDIPGILMTYAEIQFLISEAKVRWGSEITDAVSAEENYKNGVSAAMKLLSEFKIEAITDAEIDQYFIDKPFPADTEGRIKAINEEMWILHLHNAPEAYANWRRTDYPKLKPSNDYGAITIESQSIPRRLNYPLSERSYNRKAYEAAIEAMGGRDNWNARVWWDKE
ncbi:hypothetical protein GGR21_003170 [Dysgonomonas hofstadii]|uniref:Starch-binding associating with outer membrane n=1 Tax=Dysgonomonas hofstadii TaxID=637886 RepID=A0A840CZ70_9BACT|nr:SusD/RagB family nutrient-binding outer membrane lipoprotein [Dysgonomonas hofstadii]MBB4037253.1 hypothetical protein [Dysgonomonas hofstadii]